MTGKSDVAQLVIRYGSGGEHRYFLARRTRDGYWEWIGGKREDGETIEEAAMRELSEEIKLDFREDDAEIVRVAKPYVSRDSSSYELYPVLMDMDAEKAEKVENSDLSREHDRFEWIQIDDFPDFNTLGQRKALERLDIVDEELYEVAVAVTRHEETGKYLVMKRSDEESSSGLWSFPGGLVEDESVEEAAIRELKEETGLEAEIVDSAEPFRRQGSIGPLKLYFFLAETGSKEVVLNEEHSEYCWIELEELENLETHDRTMGLERLGLVG